MGFHQQSLATRISGMAGKPAEAAFVAYMEAERGYKLGEKVFRFGLDQLPTGNAVAATFPAWLLHTPDFIQVGGHLWEVEGTKYEDFQFKAEKLESLNVWASRLTGKRQLRWCLYRSQDHSVIVCSHATVLWAINQPEAKYTDDLYDGKAGWQVPYTVFASKLVECDPFKADEKLADLGGAA